MTGDAVADGVADISAGYLTALLQRSSPGAEVTDVRAERIGTGQIGASYRLHLRGKDVPPTLVAKVAAEDRAARERVKDGYRKEVRFYLELGDRVLGHVPRAGTVRSATTPPRSRSCSTISRRQCLCAGRRLHVRAGRGRGAEPRGYPRRDMVRSRRCSPPAGSRAGIRRLVNSSVTCSRAPSTSSSSATARRSAMPTSTPCAALRRRQAVGQPPRWSCSRSCTATTDSTTSCSRPRVPWSRSTGRPPPSGRPCATSPTSSRPAWTWSPARPRAGLLGIYADALVDGGVDRDDAQRSLQSYGADLRQGPLITVLGAVYAAATRSTRPTACSSPWRAAPVRRCATTGCSTRTRHERTWRGGSPAEQ